MSWSLPSASPGPGPLRPGSSGSGVPKGRRTGSRCWRERRGVRWRSIWRGFAGYMRGTWRRGPGGWSCPRPWAGSIRVLGARGLGSGYSRRSDGTGTGRPGKSAGTIIMSPRFSEPRRRRCGRVGWGSGRRVIHSVTASPRTCWRPGTTFARGRSSGHRDVSDDDLHAWAQSGREGGREPSGPSGSAGAPRSVAGIGRWA